MTIKDCRIIDLPRFSDERGTLTVIENDKEIPFEIRRIYYLHNNSTDMARGKHAHKKLNQFIIAMNGSFDITIDDGNETETYNLRDCNQGLFICPMIWRDIRNFTKDAICVVLASEFFDEDDYLRNYGAFLKAVNNS